jgi:hypothetical protein
VSEIVIDVGRGGEILLRDLVARKHPLDDGVNANAVDDRLDKVLDEAGDQHDRSFRYIGLIICPADSAKT